MLSKVPVIDSKEVFKGSLIIKIQKGIDSGRDNSAETDLPFNVPYRGKDIS